MISVFLDGVMVSERTADSAFWASTFCARLLALILRKISNAWLRQLLTFCCSLSH